MPVRLKKFIGVFLLIILVVVYAELAVLFAGLYFAESAWYVHMVYFFVTGLLWVLPAMGLIRWMAGPKSDAKP